MIQSRDIIALGLLACMTLAGCSGDVKQTDRGVAVKVTQQAADGPQLVRLQVMGERIIQVSATPESKFNDRPSLVVLPQEKTPFTVKQDGDVVTVSTAEVNASVLKTTGEVWFTDKNGKTILEEEKGGGKRFAPITVDDTKGYTTWQTFESPDDEAFYGLGQHQANEFNYKGKNEELFQYNTKVSIPFIVSNKNYGIYLDSYSLCRWGSPDDYSQLGEVFKLYDKEGAEGALTGTYVPKENAKDGTIVRREAQINFAHLERGHLDRVIGLPEGFPYMGSHVTFEGEIEADKTGDYKFILYYAGYTTVYIDGKTVVPERWRTAWNPNSYKFSATLEAGKRVPIKIDWTPDGYVSYSGLRVLPPTGREGKHSWWSEMTQQLDYYFIAGESMDDVISGYRTLTGKARIMPRWAMGFWQSRERYTCQDELLAALKEFRRREIPIDNIVQDWSYWPQDAWGSHDFDAERFPDPKGMIDEIHNQNAHVMISVWPKFYASTENYKELDANGWMYQQAIKDSIKDWIGPGYIGSFYDAYSEGARKLFWKQMKEKLYVLGIDAWWMDASEPNVRDCTDLQYRKDLCGPTALGSSTEYFNAYALMNAEAIYNGQRGDNPDSRVFLLTRSGFAGLQRYSTATWSGDIATRWEDMKAQITAGLNFAMCGIPYWTMDIGGFCVENRYVDGYNVWKQTGAVNTDMKEWQELNARWFQFGAFCPLYRAHGQYPLREIWEIGSENQPVYKSMVYYTKLRYRLMPYIYSMAGQTWLSDYTIMRPLVMDFTSDANVNDIDDQFMFGPALMINPVTTYGARSREVYFPAGSDWYDFYTGKFQQGGQTATVDAPYERVPIFVRAGSILPVGPEMQYADEKKAENIVLYVYQGADGDFTLYEDEDTNYNYEKGAYATIGFHYDEATGELTIGARQGSFEGMLTERSFTIVPVCKDAPRPFSFEKGIPIKYNGKEIKIKIINA